MYDRYCFCFDGPISGSCVIPDDVGDRIQEWCVDRDCFPDFGFKGDQVTLFYAVERWDGFLLHEGDPDEDPQPPSLREFVELRGKNPSKDDSLRDYLVEFRGMDPADEVEIAVAIRHTRENLDEPITDGELEYWLEWDYPNEESTHVRAYHHLIDLPLDDGQPCGDELLGSISFIEGDYPGSDAHYVVADSRAAIACLQYCLNELRAGIKIILLR